MPATRSTAVGAIYVAIALTFFFGIGLAGGAAYRLLTADEPGQQLADGVTPSSATPPALPPAAPRTMAAQAPMTAPAIAEQLAQLAPSAPPSVPPAPPADALSAPAAPDSAPQAAAPAPLPYAAVMSPAPAAAPRAVAQRRAAVPTKKPRLAAKATAPAQIVALHGPPAAPGNLAGPFRVQFGAFANEENARRVQWAVEATGLKVEVTQAPGAGGHALYYLRSPSYRDYAAALSAAQTVQGRVEHFINAIPIDYAILGDHSPIEQQADAR